MLDGVRFEGTMPSGVKAVDYCGGAERLWTDNPTLAIGISVAIAACLPSHEPLPPQSQLAPPFTGRMSIVPQDRLLVRLTAGQHIDIMTPEDVSARASTVEQMAGEAMIASDILMAFKVGVTLILSGLLLSIAIAFWSVSGLPTLSAGLVFAGGMIAAGATERYRRGR